MVDSWHCLDRFVPEGISQVLRRSEVGNTKRRSLHTRLSSGTSAGTFAVYTGPYRKYRAKASTKNESWHVFGTISKKGLENWSSRFEPKNSWLSFSRGSAPPLKRGKAQLFCTKGFVRVPRWAQWMWQEKVLSLRGDGRWKAKKAGKKTFELHASWSHDLTPAGRFCCYRRSTLFN